MDRAWITVVAVVAVVAVGACGDGADVPADRQWAQTGTMVQARLEHSSTVLAGDRVLVAGGRDGVDVFSPLASAELFSPGDGPDGSWAALPSMQIARTDHTAATVPDGVAVIGGGTAAVELYSVSSGEWSGGSPMSVARSGHATARLDDGRILVAGGEDPDSALASAEIYDPIADAWSPAAPMSVSRADAVAVLLDDGRVLVVGDPGAEIYDADADRWSATAPIPASPTAGHAVGRLGDGRVAVAGGQDGAAHLASLSIYDPDTDSWDQLALSQARAFASVETDSDGGVLVVGGCDPCHSFPFVERFDGTVITIAPVMTRARCAHASAVLSDGRIVATGGVHAAGEPLATAEILGPR